MKTSNARDAAADDRVGNPMCDGLTSEFLRDGVVIALVVVVWTLFTLPVIFYHLPQTVIHKHVSK